MSVGIAGPAGVTTTTPPAKELLTKIAKIEVADGTTGFAAFGLPQGAFIAGVYTISMGANATQNINAGFSAAGTELINAFAPNSTGYAASGAATGSAVGTVLTSDKTVFVRANVGALTNPVYVKVEYYIPQSGMPF